MRQPRVHRTKVAIGRSVAPIREEPVKFVDDRPPEPIEAAYRDLVMRGLEQSRRGEVASDDDVKAVFASFKC